VTLAPAAVLDFLIVEALDQGRSSSSAPRTIASTSATTPCVQREFKVPRKLEPEVVDAAFLPENPGELTVWGVVNGLTSVAKQMPYAEERAKLQRVAGELLVAR
jgi:hypothetical protein